jgi:ribosomal protein S10
MNNQKKPKDVYVKMSSLSYTIEHYSKQYRKDVLRQIRESSKKRGEEQPAFSSSFFRKKRRVWTLNRSPHGNKTAREQFGRDHWQIRRSLVTSNQLITSNELSNRSIPVRNKREDNRKNQVDSYILFKHIRYYSPVQAKMKEIRESILN